MQPDAAAGNPRWRPGPVVAWCGGGHDAVELRGLAPVTARRRPAWRSAESTGSLKRCVGDAVVVWPMVAFSCMPMSLWWHSWPPPSGGALVALWWWDWRHQPSLYAMVTMRVKTHPSLRRCRRRHWCRVLPEAASGISGTDLGSCRQCF